MNKLNIRIKNGKPFNNSKLNKYLEILDKVKSIKTETLSESELKEKVTELINVYNNCTEKIIYLPELLAYICEVSKRKIGLSPFDVQILAGTSLLNNDLIEMETGEGKTLAAVFPAVIKGLDKKGVHILTFNDYLAKRDANWMKPIYDFFGLSVGYINDKMDSDQRKIEYQKDITYLTAKEAGFDYLRDSTALKPEDKIQNSYNFAIIDEADSILIDEARFPLVLAAEREDEIENTILFSKISEKLSIGTHFEVVEDEKNVYLTDEGTEIVEKETGCTNLYDDNNIDYLTGINCALYANNILKRDIDYIVKNDEIKIVDEFTGRVAQSRHWPDGIQSAVEAKENVPIKKRGRILARTTIQHYVKNYDSISGMTATASTSSEEFISFYNMDIVIIPPNIPCSRIDHNDYIFVTKDYKYKRLVQDIVEENKKGRPILIGTSNIEESEYIAKLLQNEHLSNINILNAKNDEYEAKIIAEAGLPGAITVSTNMAGRGTDIKLGGSNQEYYNKVSELGGLHVIGINKHESIRIDNQLRGRAGRQGDPGSSRYYISLEDDLTEKHGLRKVIPEYILSLKESEPINKKIVIQMVSHVQKYVQGQNEEIRKTLWNYSYVIENQREIIEEKRIEIQNSIYENDIEQNQKIKKYLLYMINKYWSEYLEEIEYFKDGIHLISLSGKNPIDEYHREAIRLFDILQNKIEKLIQETIINQDKIKAEESNISKPSATWTYMVSDNYFINNIKVGEDVPYFAGKNMLATSLVMFTYFPAFIVNFILMAFSRKNKPK